MLRCHIAAFAAIGGVPSEILYDRMKTAVTGEDDEGHIVYNRSLHRRSPGTTASIPRACRPYRAKTKGKVERPFSYIREDFFLARSFRNLDDLNAQLAALARHGRQLRAARHDAADRRGGLRGRAARAAAVAGYARSMRSSSSNGASAMTGWSRSAATTTAFPIAPARIVEVHNARRR